MIWVASASDTPKLNRSDRAFSSVADLPPTAQANGKIEARTYTLSGDAGINIIGGREPPTLGTGYDCVIAQVVICVANE